MLGSGEISKRASVAPLLAAKAGSKVCDVQIGGGVLCNWSMSTAESILARVAICSRARHA